MLALTHVMVSSDGRRDVGMGLGYTNKHAALRSHRALALEPAAAR
jgi:hypothetical protein